MNSNVPDPALNELCVQDVPLATPGYVTAFLRMGSVGSGRLAMAPPGECTALLAWHPWILVLPNVLALNCGPCFGHADINGGAYLY